MKKLATVLLVLTITACTSQTSIKSTDVNWTQGNLAALSDTAIQLKSNLWTD